MLYFVNIASEFMWFDEEYGQGTIFCNDELELYVNEEVFDLKDEALKALILGKYIDIDKRHGYLFCRVFYHYFII